MVSTNLITSYKPTDNTFLTHKNVADDFDVNKELRNKTFIKPLPSNGKLLNPTIFEYPSVIRKDILYDIKAFVKAINGKANDHELGHLNDVGMKIGGLAIASYLFTQKQTPMTKAFEFIGLGTFFASMNLWPKLFIQLPAWLIHGVNVRQEYQDSFGRKKMFYQDHQFIPWDLYSDKDINKIGDRLNIPKDLPNRRDFIQEKMRKIALQNNTLWMLTAGFATPLMSALLCNALEKPVSKYADYYTDKKAENLLTKFHQHVEHNNFQKEELELSKLLSDYEGKNISEKEFKQIVANLTKNLDYIPGVNIERDLYNMLPYDKTYSITENTLQNIQKLYSSQFKKLNLSEEQLNQIIPTIEELNQTLTSKNLLNGEYKDLSSHTLAIQNLVKNKINGFISANPDKMLAQRLNFLHKELHASKIPGKNSPLLEIFKSSPSFILNDSMISDIKGISKILNKLKAEISVLDEYAYLKVAQAPETILANTWNQTTDSIFKALKFTDKEITKARLDRDFANDILRNKIETITSDKTAYENFVKEFASSLSSMYSRMATVDLHQSNGTNQYKSLVETSFETARQGLAQKGMKHTISALVGYDDSAMTSAKHLMTSFVTDRISGVKNSFYRFLNLADLYRKISTLEGVDHVLTSDKLREVKEEMVELAKEMAIDGHSSDFAVKFWQKRNPTPNKNDYSQIQVLGGKVQNLYLGTHNTNELSELPNDSEYYKNVMRLIFGGDIHKDTEALLDGSLLEEFKKYRSDSLYKLGNLEYFVKPRHLVDGKTVKNSSEVLFLQLGCTPTEITHKMLQQKYNSTRWLKHFGKLGIALAAITVGAQFFIGKLSIPEREIK